MNESSLFRFNKQNLKYIVLDTETESLNGVYSRPWEISWIVVENGVIKSEHQRFLYYKDFNISKGAAAVTRFDYQKYRNLAKDPGPIYKELSNFLFNKDYLIVGQNIIQFDALQIKNLQNYLQIQQDYSYLYRTYDTLALGRAMNLNIQFPQTKEEILPWQYKLCSYRKKGLKASLEALAKQLEIPYDENQHHSGLYDVKLTKLVFEGMFYRLEVW